MVMNEFDIKELPDDELLAFKENLVFLKNYDLDKLLNSNYKNELIKLKQIVDKIEIQSF